MSEKRCTGLCLTHMDGHALLKVCGGGSIISIPIEDYKITSSMREGTELVITICPSEPFIEVSTAMTEATTEPKTSARNCAP